MLSPQNEAFSCILTNKALEFNDWNLLAPKQIRFELTGTNGRADYLLFHSLLHRAFVGKW
jgi:hypothetical protein